MPELKRHTCEDFLKFIRIVEDFQNNHKTSWYRGVTQSDHSLSPSIFRHPKKKKIAEIQNLEIELVSAFKQRSLPFVAQTFNNEWEQMFFMQHYGIPTRILDWTESPFIALYFSLSNCERLKNGKPKTDAAFWMLDPEIWNQDALKDISYTGGILTPNDEQVKSYSLKANLEERKNLPIMIYGTHNSPRIVAQRGAFSIFGKRLDSMEKIYESGGFREGVIEKIIIPKNYRDSITVSLFKKGISDSTIYPDLYGLSLEIKRRYGFTR